MRIAMQRASTCDALSYLATRSSTLNDPEILSKQSGPPLASHCWSPIVQRQSKSISVWPWPKPSSS
jgi:hypothetical protein